MGKDEQHAARTAFGHETRMKTREGAATRAWECDAIAAYYRNNGKPEIAADYEREAEKSARIAMSPLMVRA